MRKYRSVFLLFFLAFVLLPAAPLFAQARDPKLDALADEVARGIEKNKPEHAAKNQTMSFLVFSFQDSAGGITQLGIHLANELSLAVANRLRKVRAVDPGDLRALTQLEHLDAAVFQQDKVAQWGASLLGANLAIVGTIEPGADAIRLNIRVIGEDPNKKVYLERRELDWTDERHAWQGQPVPKFPPSNPWKDVPNAGAKGYTQPVCVDCTQPPYSEEARKAQFSGTATALLLIGDDGAVREVRLDHGLPCDLNSRIRSTLKNWSFQPARGPDGRPTAVQVMLEVTFRVM